MTDINKADIVNRMRSIDPTWDVWDAKGMTLLKECGLWCHEAADEIERLREENAYLQQIIKEYQRAMGFDEECTIALGEKE